jgi:hypothetical protein
MGNDMTSQDKYHTEPVIGQPIILNLAEVEGEDYK